MSDDGSLYKYHLQRMNCPQLVTQHHCEVFTEAIQPATPLVSTVLVGVVSTDEVASAGALSTHRRPRPPEVPEYCITSAKVTT